MNFELELQLIASLIAISCSIPGVFLVLRKMSMMADSITHTILLGIVLGFFITKDLQSPFLIVGATLMGIFTVWITELLYRSKLVSEDSAIGAIFPLLFSISIILISRHAGSVHLDTDSVLLGELAFAPFDRLIINGVDIGAKGIYTAIMILLLNVIFVLLFYKELKLSTFDILLSSVLGFLPVILHYGLMTMVSITTVVAFQSVGSILVIAFMIGPPITAYLLTSNLKYMLFLSCFIGCINSVLGYQVSKYYDISIAGTIAMITGLTFLLVLLFSKKNGIITTVLRRHYQKKDLLKHSILIYLSDSINHVDCNTLYYTFRWNKQQVTHMITSLDKEELISIHNNQIEISNKGRSYIKDMV